MDLIEKTRNAVVHAGTTFSEDRLRAYKRALEIEEGNDNALWALEQMIANSSVAAREGFPLCDDTGIPHVLLEIGEGRELDPNFFKDIEPFVIMISSKKTAYMRNLPWSGRFLF